MKYRKKPVEIEAVQFKDDSADTLIKLQEFMQSDLRVLFADPDNPVIKIETLEGIMDASIGDFIIKGVNGELYPCKPDIFEKTYEAVNEEDFMCNEIGKKKAMLSQPMAGQTDEEIIATREKAIKALEEMGFEVVNTLFTDEWYDKENMEKRGVVQIPLCFLAKSLENMSLCHAAYFCKGWEYARGCRLEHEAAKAYGLQIIYEPDI